MPMNLHHQFAHSISVVKSTQKRRPTNCSVRTRLDNTPQNPRVRRSRRHRKRLPSHLFAHNPLRPRRHQIFARDSLLGLGASRRFAFPEPTAQRRSLSSQNNRAPVAQRQSRDHPSRIRRAPSLATTANRPRHAADRSRKNRDAVNQPFRFPGAVHHNRNPRTHRL